MNPFQSVLGSTPEDVFDDADAYVPAHLPDPTPFLETGRLLTGEEHVAFHRLTRELFEERSVYDVTFGYNLARLNRDRRHPDAGYRYAAETDGAVDGADDAGEAVRHVLRAVFTPTTEFCPQSRTLTVGSFRAWNELADRHEYDLVRVRVDEMHQSAASVNRRLRSLEDHVRETGSVPGVPAVPAVAAEGR